MGSTDMDDLYQNPSDEESKDIEGHGITRTMQIILVAMPIAIWTSRTPSLNRVFDVQVTRNEHCPIEDFCQAFLRSNLPEGTAFFASSEGQVFR